MHVLLMLIGYPDKLDEFVQRCEDKWYRIPPIKQKFTQEVFVDWLYEDKNGDFYWDYFPCGIETVEKPMEYIARPKFREVRVYDVIFNSQAKEQIMNDIMTGCRATWTVPEPRDHPFHFRIFRKIMTWPFRMLGMRPPDTKLYKKLQTGSNLGMPENYFKMHGLVLAEMPDRSQEGIEQV